MTVGARPPLDPELSAALAAMPAGLQQPSRATRLGYVRRALSWARD